MIEKFNVFRFAKQYYSGCKNVKIPKYLENQLLRASASIALNIAEGSGKRTPEDQTRFYSIALGSLRECEAILAIERVNDPNLAALGDKIGANFTP